MGGKMIFLVFLLSAFISLVLCVMIAVGMRIIRNAKTTEWSPYKDYLDNLKDSYEKEHMTYRSP
jgi:hypothetical protein